MCIRDRGQMNLELAAEELPLELLVLADVGADHCADPLVALSLIHISEPTRPY